MLIQLQECLTGIPAALEDSGITTAFKVSLI